MRKTLPSGFTLIELLVVISIIAILAAMLLPALARAKRAALVKNAQVEVGRIAMAIQSYESQYSQFPATRGAIDSAVAQGEDFTYGTRLLSDLKTPSGTQPITSPGGSLPDGAYQANNAEIMAVLLDLESYGNGTPTVNKGHVKNPQRGALLNATVVDDVTKPGVGPDGVYRDPWKNPYFITIDLNSDDRCRDSFYRRASVSRQTGQAGFFGLSNSKDPGGAGDNFEYSGHVMVWSAGPDGMVELGPANAGANKDNVLNWK